MDIEPLIKYVFGYDTLFLKICKENLLFEHFLFLKIDILLSESYKSSQVTRTYRLVLLD
jgi:hypothetical protein